MEELCNAIVKFHQTGLVPRQTKGDMVPTEPKKWVKTYSEKVSFDGHRISHDPQYYIIGGLIPLVVNEATKVLAPKSFYFISNTKDSNKFMNQIMTKSQIKQAKPEECLYETLCLPAGIKFYLDVDGVTDLSAVKALVIEVHAAFKAEFGETVEVVTLRSFPGKKKNDLMVDSFHIIVNSKKTFAGVAEVEAMAKKYMLLRPDKGQLVATFSIADPAVYNRYQRMRIPGSWKLAGDRRVFKPVDVDLETILEISMHKMLIQTHNYDSYPEIIYEGRQRLTDAQFAEIEAIIGDKISNIESKTLFKKLPKYMKMAEDSRRMKSLFERILANYSSIYKTIMQLPNCNIVMANSGLLQPASLWSGFIVHKYGDFDTFERLKNVLTGMFSTNLQVSGPMRILNIKHDPILALEPKVFHSPGEFTVTVSLCDEVIHVVGVCHKQFRFSNQTTKIYTTFVDEGQIVIESIRKDFGVEMAYEREYFIPNQSDQPVFPAHFVTPTVDEESELED